MALISFEEIFWLPLLALTINGSHPLVARNKGWAFKFAINSSIVVFLASLLLNSIFCYDINKGNYTEACRNFSMVIVSSVISFKYSIMLIHQKDLKELIKEIKADYVLAEDLPSLERAIVEKYAAKGIWIGKLWFIVAFITSSLFPITAFTKMIIFYLQGEFRLVQLFEFEYPTFLRPCKDELYPFLGMFGLCLWFGVYAATMYAGFDTLGPILVLHMCGQLELIEIRILRLFSEGNDAVNVKKRLKAIIIHLQRIYSLVRKTENCFTMLYEMSLKTTAVTIPVSAIVILEGIKNGTLKFEFLSLVVGCFIHCYVPCYYSDLLMDKGNAVRDAMYSCGWEKRIDKSIGITFVVMTCQAGRPLALRSVFTILNLDAFSKMCKDSYTILNLMNASFK